MTCVGGTFCSVDFGRQTYSKDEKDAIGHSWEIYC
jgi:hypothetical protein